MSEWKEYTGSDEQICEMKSGFLYRNKSGSQSDKALFGSNFVSSAHLKNFLNNCETTHYLVCDPHPYADLIKIWADTGCPVWIKFSEQYNEIDFLGFELVDYLQSGTVFKTTMPNFNIPGAEYRLTPFGD